MAQKDYYGFEDIVESQKGIFGDDCPGICDQSAMTAFSKAQGVPEKAGLTYTVPCENCGPKKITIDWPEMVAVKNGISPQYAYRGQPNLDPSVWGFDQMSQTWFPDVKCSHCQWQFRLMISPNEINNFVNYAIGKGFLPEPAFRQLSQICQNVKQQMQASRG